MEVDKKGVISFSSEVSLGDELLEPGKYKVATEAGGRRYVQKVVIRGESAEHVFQGRATRRAGVGPTNHAGSAGVNQPDR